MKDFAFSEGGFSNIIITRELLQSVKLYSRHQLFLEVQQKLNENEEKLRLEKEGSYYLMKEIQEKNFATKNR